jgi:hypothetical protein
LFHKDLNPKHAKDYFSSIKVLRAL